MTQRNDNERMNNNRTPLQEAIKDHAISTMTEGVYDYEHDKLVNEAAQSYSDLPSKIEGMKSQDNSITAFVCNEALDDILTLLENQDD